MGVRGLNARRRRVWAGFSLLGLVGALLLVSAGAAENADAAKKKLTRYSIVHGCFALKPAGAGYIAQTGSGYTASASHKAAAEPFRLQATELGTYLFYGPARDFLGQANGGAVVLATEPSPLTEWVVTGAGNSFRIANLASARELLVSDSDELSTGSGGGGDSFRLRPTTGCAKYPEVGLNVRGGPSKSSPRYGEVKGLLEGHMHQMAFEFLGGKAHCGRPWHRYGAPYALVDCADHEPNGCTAILENILYGNPARCHDTVGWPTFNDWPHPNSLTHESSYYRWVERAYRGGLRIFVNLMVENRTLCEIYPYRQPGYNCNEMDSVMREIERMHELEDYIDAQSGGPGKGWYRIVKNPFQARRVISRGKLAVVMGMEVSEPFNCRLVPINQPAPQCTPANIDDWLERLKALGISQLEIINKTDNALGGVAGDSGEFGIATSIANFGSSGSFWDLGPCEDPNNHDHSPTTAVLPHNDDLIIANGLRELLPINPLPIYPEPPSCNQYGLSDLGEHAVNEIMDQRMIFDPDHLSVLARNKSLDLVERRDYPGIFSSHSWSTPNATPRIYKLGGVITPSAKRPDDFIHKWEHLRNHRSKNDQYFGVGFGADANGFANQGTARPDAAQNPLRYPIKSFDRKVTLDRQVSGERSFDLNVDGVAHYGLYPDWLADLRLLGGNKIIRDMGRGAEAYLQMWERTYGVPEVRCAGWKQRRLTGRGLGAIKLGAKHRKVLKRAGQPVKRKRNWRWCAGGKKRSVVAGFTKGGRVGFVVSNVRKHRAGGIGPGAGAGRLGGASKVGRGVYADGRFVYVVRGGRVTHAGVATKPSRFAARLRRAAR